MSEIAVWSLCGLLSLGVIAVVIVQIQKISQTVKPAAKRAQSVFAAPPVREIKSKSGLNSDILKEGTGQGAKSGDFLTVHYTGFLTTGTKVDSSYDRKRPFDFKLGVAAVIYGWDEALLGVKVGEIRRVTVPSDMAYGKKGSDRVPPNSTMIFEIEVLKIKAKS